MDIVSLKCPSCGGDLKMSVGSPLGFCPFCNTQVCVDEVVDDMKMIRMQKELDHETSIAKRETEYRLKKRKWDISHGISMLVIGVLTFIAFFFAATEICVGLGAMAFIFLIIAAMSIPLFFAGTYPLYNSEMQGTAGKMTKRSLIALRSFGMEAISVLISLIITFILIEL